MGEQVRWPVGITPTLWQLPDPHDAEDDWEVLAEGADLQPGTLFRAYSTGLFPMELSPEPDLGWWSPNPRGIIPLDGLRISKSMRQSAKHFTVTIDTDFEATMRGCMLQTRPHGWINEKFIAAYCTLHELGYAHSFETRDSSGQLVGGLYGVEFGGLFAGESMFHRVRDASKVALMGLVDALGGAAEASTGRLLDTQWRTDHLATLGCIEIPRNEYLDRLPKALVLQKKLGPLAGT